MYFTGSYLIIIIIILFLFLRKPDNLFVRICSLNSIWSVFEKQFTTFS